MAKDSTNLASEFYVLSVLHRLGATALLTLGHHKAVDIAVVRSAGRVKTIDVKGAATRDWFIDSLTEFRRNHWIVFVAYRYKITKLRFQPEVYIVPSEDVPRLTYTSPKGTKVIRLSSLQKNASKYRDKWKCLL